MSRYKISEGELFSQIKLLLKDEFIAKVDDDGEDIFIEFINGQKFKLSLTEL